MRHQDLLLNHRLESYVYANTGDRTGASGFVTGDIGRIAYQQDTKQYWRLASTAPDWQIIASSVYATLQTGVLNPGSTTSTSQVMMGLSGLITPSSTGKISFTIHGTVTNTVTTSTSTLQLSYGSGAAPGNGAAPVGLNVGSTVTYKAVTGGYFVPFSLTALVTGLVIGTQYWLDLKAFTGAGGTADVVNASIAAHELP